MFAKIETGLAICSLPDIIVSGAGAGPFGAMIARGDLAVEGGRAPSPHQLVNATSTCGEGGSKPRKHQPATGWPSRLRPPQPRWTEAHRS